MPNQSAAQDDNQVFALIAHSGTAGTSDTIRVVADSAGNLGVNIAGTEPIELVAGTITRVSTVGTLELGSVAINGTPTVSNLGTNVNVVTGTVQRIQTIGTLELGSMTNTGTNVNIITGTQQALCTVGTVGTVLGIGGTVQVSGASAGTFVNIVTGTQQTLGTVGTIPGVGTITNLGSITNIGMLHAGTVVTTLALNT